MTDGNIVRRDIAPDDLVRNFNYRNYFACQRLEHQLR